jgi:hypothetical protein
VYCARHPATDAIWECARCGALHCDGCVRRVGDERKSIAACAHCDGVLKRLDVRVVAPVRDEAQGLLRRPFTATGLVTVVAIAGLAGLSDVPWPLVDLLIGLVSHLALLATYFNVIDHVGSGKPGFPAPVEADGWPPATLMMRGLLCMMILCVPFAVWLAWARADDLGVLSAAHPFTAVLLGLVALAWLTAGLLAMLLTVSGLAAFWPPALVRAVALDPGAYGRLLGLMVATTTAVALARWMILALPRIGFVSTFLLTAVTAFAVFAQAALVGGFVHRHREVYTTR